LAASASPMEKEFAAYMAQYNKHYLATEEYEARLALFAETHHMIAAHNMEGHSWSLAHNHMSDWTESERNSMLGYVKKERNPENAHQFDVAAVPATVDWRQSLKSVNDVKDQAKCGSCWAFSTTGSIESNYEIAHKEYIPLSEQQLVDCSWWDNGCGGGNIDDGFAYAASKGMEGEADYPYKGADGTCAYNKDKVRNSKVAGHLDIASYDVLQMKAAVAHGPVSIAIQANQKPFHFYKGGIIPNNGICGEDLDHAVLAVGFGSENGVDYFIVKNSWTSKWGEKGFVRLEHNSWSCACGCTDAPSLVKVE